MDTSHLNSSTPDEAGSSEDSISHLQKSPLWLRILSSCWTLAITLLILILLSPLIYMWYQVAKIPDIGEPFDVAAFKAFTLPDEENAFTLYRSASEILITREIFFSGNPDQLQDAYDNEDAVLEQGWSVASEETTAWLDANREAMQIWKQGTKLHDAIEVPRREGQYDSLLPATQASREFTRLVILEAARLNEQGKPHEAWEWYRAVLRGSRHVGMRGTLIGRAVEVANHANATGPILNWSAQANVTSEDLRQAWADVRDADKLRTPISESLKTDYLYLSNIATLEVTQELAGQSGYDRRVLRWLGGSERYHRLTKLVVANWLSQCDLPRYERESASSLFRPSLNEIETSTTVAPELIVSWHEQTTKDMSVFGVIGGHYTPAATTIFDASDRGQARQHGLELGFALQLYYREHQEFPETLDALLDGYLDEIPADPFGQGEAMRYRREETGNATVWSIGLDEVDQEGKVAPDPNDSENMEYDEVFPIRAPRSP